MLFAFLGGLIPTLFWLWFWLREDAARPEPKTLIASAFVAGMVVVWPVLLLQTYGAERFADEHMRLLVWVAVEEILKYAGAIVIVLWHRAVDEPIDLVIYMITIALGFAALENGLFIFNPLSSGEIAQSVLTGHFRFVGATLLHVLSSATVGVCMAFAFYMRKWWRVFYATLGLILAIVLHALFNFSIMNASGGQVLTVFLFVWIGVIVLFLIFEKLKLFERRHRRAEKRTR